MESTQATAYYLFLIYVFAIQKKKNKLNKILVFLPWEIIIMNVSCF